MISYLSGFHINLTQQGGAVYIDGGTGVFASCSFEGNKAVSNADIVMIHDVNLCVSIAQFKLQYVCLAYLTELSILNCNFVISCLILMINK